VLGFLSRHELDLPAVGDFWATAFKVEGPGVCGHRSGGDGPPRGRGGERPHGPL